MDLIDKMMDEIGRGTPMVVMYSKDTFEINLWNEVNIYVDKNIKEAFLNVKESDIDITVSRMRKIKEVIHILKRELFNDSADRDVWDWKIYA